MNSIQILWGSMHKQEAINEAWDQAEEIYSGLCEMTNEEIIECKHAFIERASRIMVALHEYAESGEED